MQAAGQREEGPHPALIQTSQAASGSGETGGGDGLATSSNSSMLCLMLCITGLDLATPIQFALQNRYLFESIAQSGVHQDMYRVQLPCPNDRSYDHSPRRNKGVKKVHYAVLSHFGSVTIWSLLSKFTPNGVVVGVTTVDARVGLA